MQEVIFSLVIAFAIFSPVFWSLFHGPIELDLVIIKQFFGLKVKITELNKPRFEMLRDKLLELRKQGNFDGIGTRDLRVAFNFQNTLFVYPYLKQAEVWDKDLSQGKIFYLNGKRTQEIFAIILQAEDSETLPKFGD